MNAVITGGTKGIGRAIADLLASKGIDLFICARNQQELDQCQRDISKAHPGVKVLTLKTDVSDKAQVDAFGDFVLSHVEQVDVLVNNAGVFLPGAVLEEEAGCLEMMINTNLYSAYYLTRKLVPSMVSYGGGHIFNMCSIASKVAYPNGGSYSISKFALLGFNKVLREELKDKQIKVTAILPGATWSNSWAGVELPESRLMQAHDIALAVYNAMEMSPSAVVEEITIRPQLGDL
jgi:short-subunit dehydrogenase